MRTRFRWETEDIIARLTELKLSYESAGREFPTHAEYRDMAINNDYLPSVTTVKNRLGGWSRAKEAIGVEPMVRRWTDEERDYLMENAGILSITTMAQRLGRTNRAVAKAMETMGIGFFTNQGMLTPGQLARMIGVSKSMIHEFCVKKKLPARRVGKWWFIDPTSVRYIRAHLERRCGVKRWPIEIMAAFNASLDSEGYEIKKAMSACGG